MTKSRTLRKAGAVVLSLAMAFSMAAVGPNASAATKVKLSSSKGTITVGKTKKVTIKNTKKSNIKKVTFKYSNTKKRVTAKRSGLTLKFKGNKAGTVTITSKIVLKKAVANKTKYNLKYKATVKKATPAATATPGELKLDSVEAAVRGEQGVNVVVAYFSTDVGALDPGSIEIRDKANNLFTVEKVVMSDGNKKATMTLTGSSNAGTAGSTEFLSYNTDYTMSVKTSSGKVLAKDFYIPEAIAGATVYNVDKTNKKISVIALDNRRITNANPLTYGDRKVDNLIVPDSLGVDFEDVLGKTFTVEYDKTNTITKLTDNNEKVVFGAFKATKADQALTDLATGEKYTLRTASAKMEGSQIIEREASGKVTGRGAFAIGADYFIAWAKVTLTSANTVKFIEVEDAFTGFIKVASVANNTVVNGSTQVNLKDFVILKDGKQIKVDALAAGDVVAYSNDDAFAEVLPAANTTTGALEDVSDGSFKFGGKTYGISNADAAKGLLFATKYSKKGAAEGTVNNDYLVSLKKAAKDVTVTLNRANQAVYLEGDQAAAATTSVSLVLTANAGAYAQSKTSYLRLKGWNGTEIKTYDINIADLASIVIPNGTKVEKKGAGFKLGKTNVDDLTATGPDDAAMTNDYATGTIADATTAGKKIIADVSAAFTKNELVILTLNDKNVVTAIDARDGANNDAVAFKAGLTVVKGKQIAASTPIYISDTATAGKENVSMVTYDKFTGNVAAGDNDKVHVYSTDGKNVSAIVVEKSALGEDTDVDKKEGIITKIDYTADTTVVKELEILVGNEVVVAENCVAANVAKKTPTAYKAGDIITAVFKKGTKNLSRIEDATGTTKSGILTVVDSANSIFTIGTESTRYQLATVGTTSIGVADKDGSYASTNETMASLFKAAEGKQVTLSTLAGSTSDPLAVDTIVANGAAITGLAAKQTAAKAWIQTIADYEADGTHAGAYVLTTNITKKSQYTASKDLFDKADAAIKAALVAYNTENNLTGPAAITISSTATDVDTALDAGATEFSGTYLTALGALENTGKKLIVSIDKQTLTADVANNTAIAAAKTALGMAKGKTADGTEVAKVTVTWSTDSTPTYSATTAGTYVFTSTATGADTGYALAADVDGLATITTITGKVTVAAP